MLNFLIGVVITLITVCACVLGYELCWSVNSTLGGYAPWAWITLSPALFFFMGMMFNYE
jgi:hypothetical protein